MFINTRNSALSGNVPSFLANGELALNRADQLLYCKHANGSIVTIANGAAIGLDSYARIRANGAFDQANGAFNKANTANVTAQAAFDKANGTFIVARLSSNVNQIPANTSAYKVTYNSQDILIGATHTVGNSHVTVLSSGAYMVVVGGQISRTSGGSNISYTDFWIRKNGTNVDRSTTRSTLTNANIFSPVINNLSLNLAANDYIEVIQAVSSAASGMGLTATTALAGGPTLPSITLTIIKITN